MTSLVTYGQCDFIISKSQVCGFEKFEVEVVNPAEDGDYFFVFNDGSPKKYGTKVEHFYTASENDREFNIRLNNGNSNCIVKTITVLASPDPSVNFLTGIIKNGSITNCGSTNDNPDFKLNLTQGDPPRTINNYVIDWGDGSPFYEGATIENLSHTYKEQGLYYLTVTVESEGYEVCNDVSATYVVFNGSTPGGSIIQPPNVANLCAPRTISFPIAGVENNVPGTSYEFFLGGELIAEYSHPVPAQFKWTFEESSCGNTSFGVKDAFVVKMEVSNPCNVSPPTIASVYIGESPTAEMTVSEDIACTGIPIEIKNESIGNTFDISQLKCTPLDKASWTIEPATGWNLNAGNLESSDKLELVFSKTGTYTVEMTIENTCDTLTVSEEIKVIQRAQADANAVVVNPNSCAPVEVNLKNLSLGDEIKYQWKVVPNNGVKFSNGNATTASPTLTFEKGGQFKVQLVASNSCSEDKWDTTIVVQSDGPLSMLPIPDQCGSFVYESDFQFHEDEVVSWDFTGGNPSSFSGQTPPAILYDVPGDYTITIFTSNICGVGETKLDFSVLSGASIDIQDNLVACIKEEKFPLQASPTGGVWSGKGIVNSNNGMFNPEKAELGDNIITYTYDDGTCSSSAQMIVTVNDIPELNAGAERTYCINEDTVTISGASPEGGWWTGNGFTNTTSGDFLPSLAGIGDHIVYYVFDAGGTGCKDSIPLKITVLNGPQLDFPDYEIFCVNSTSVFNHSSSELAAITWNFGDGSSSNDLFPNHVYKDEGEYTVEMIGTSTDNCTFILTEDIVVTKAPEADFELDSYEACFELDAKINDLSTGIISNVMWDFGDGATTDRRDIDNHLFLSSPETTQEYEVKLKVENRCGEDEMAKMVKVHTTPVAQFGLTEEVTCSPFVTEFVNVSYGSPTTFLWNLGNGEESDQNIPGQQVYVADDGDREILVSLTATNQCGISQMEKSFVVKDVEVHAILSASINKGCQPLEVEFSSVNAPNTNVLWDFKDGGLSKEKNATHVFDNAGIYEVSLIVDNGCASDTSFTKIEVWEKPDIDIQMNNEMCFGNELKILNGTTKAISHSWNFGDGKFSDLTTPPHEYANVGSYEVKYLASTALGCTDSTKEIVVVLPKPIASFDTDNDEACEKTIISLINQTEGAIAYVWYFGDNTISYEPNPEKNYEHEGVFDIKLVARNEVACKDSFTVYNAVEVLPSPKVDFTYSQDENGYQTGEIQFTNNSELSDAYIWNFGDGMHSIDENPTHSYEFNGNKSVKLIGSNSYGCIDSIVKTVTPDFRGGLFLPSAFAPLTSNNESALFMPKGFGLSEYRLEIFSSYGEIIWSTELLEGGRPVESWNGYHKGKLLPQDVYVWKAHAKFDNGSVWQGMELENGEFTNMGTITLIR